MNPTSPSRLPKRGFTLVEVIITTILIVLIMIPISQLSYNIMRATQYSRDAGEALALGQAQLESMADEDYDTLASGTRTVDAHTLTWTVTESNGVKQTVLTVSWTLRNETKFVELRAIHSPEVAANLNPSL
jgi:prepilin-type N-terminal cleavage/methylation domain-containing protein